MHYVKQKYLENQSFQPHKMFMRVTYASIEYTEHLLTPLPPQL